MPDYYADKMKNVIKLGALIVIAAIGALVIRSLFIAASRPASGGNVPMVHVRAAADELPAGLLLRDADLTWKDMPSDQVPKGALVEGTTQGHNANDLKGDLLKHAVHAGALLGVDDVIQPNAPGFLAAALKPGMRAISVAIDDVSGNAGLIQPGDFVDILLTQQIHADGDAHVDPARSVEAETIAERVRVLAVGSAFRRPKDDDNGAANQKARTVTIEVTPESAQSVTVAAHLGSLSLALRSFATQDKAPVADDTTAQIAPVWAGQVSRALQAAPVSAAPHSQRAVAPVPHVVIYRGTSPGQSSDALSGATATGAPGLPPLPSASSQRADTAPAT